MLSFEKPLYLILLIIIPLLPFVTRFKRFQGGYVSFPVTAWKGSSFHSRPFSVVLVNRIARGLVLGGFFFLIVSIAGPMITWKERIYMTRGMDIMIVLDQSPSMAGLDFPPVNRFDTARKLIVKFVQARENDAVGLVGFGREALLKVPLTTDRSVLKDRLDSLYLMEMGDGTAIGLGLAVSALHLDQSRGDRKICILITDGENNAGEINPLESADIHSQMGIKVYTIAVGAIGEVPVDFVNPDTGKKYKGNMKSTYDEKLLRTISEKTGGLFFHAESPGTLDSIFQVIDSREKMERQVQYKVHSSNLHDYAILISLMLFLAGGFIRFQVLKEVF